MNSLTSGFLLIASGLVAMGACSAQTLVYRETFGNNLGEGGSALQPANGPRSVNTNWRLYGYANATDLTAQRPVVSAGPTALDTEGMENVGTGRETTSSTNGFVYTEQPQQEYPYFFMTVGHEGAEINLDPGKENLTFEWYQRNNNASEGLRVAVRIAGQWFVTDTLFSGEGNGGPLLTQAQSFVFSREGRGWRDLAFAPGSSLALAEEARSADLPEGTITGVGVFIEPHGGYVRFDNFTVTATAGP